MQNSQQSDTVTEETVLFELVWISIIFSNDITCLKHENFLFTIETDLFTVMIPC